MTHGLILNALDFSYNKAINGSLILVPSSELAQSYLAKHDKNDVRSAVNNLIKWQTIKSGTGGFITNLGGLITLPVAIPAEMMGLTLIQLRMIAAIAEMGGYNVKDDKVKTFVFACLVGEKIQNILKKSGITMGRELTKRMILNISAQTIRQINRRVGFRLISKFGEKGVVNLSKTIPFVSGLIGGGFDATSTKLVGNLARNTFIA